MRTYCNTLIIVLFLLSTVLYFAWRYEFEQKIEAQKQRDEAYELARKAQNSAMYWYDVHEKMVWHTQPNEENED